MPVSVFGEKEVKAVLAHFPNTLNSAGVDAADKQAFLGEWKMLKKLIFKR